MVVTAAEIGKLRQGAKEATSVKLQHLAALLDTVADIGQMIRDGISPVDIAIGLDDLIEYGARVATDLQRSVPSPP
jgi:hypothetical protein